MVQLHVEGCAKLLDAHRNLHVEVVGSIQLHAVALVLVFLKFNVQQMRMETLARARCTA